MSSILPILLSATSNHGPRDNLRGFFIDADQPLVSPGTQVVHDTFRLLGYCGKDCCRNLRTSNHRSGTARVRAFRTKPYGNTKYETEGKRLRFPEAFPR